MRDTINRGFVATAALLLIAAGCALVSNALAGPERRLAWTSSSSAPAVRPVRAAAAPASPAAVPAIPAPAGDKTFAPHPDKPYLEISGEDVAALFGKGTAVFDARRSSVYREGHIAGARSFSVWESDVDDKVKALVGGDIGTSSPIVVYCSGGECEDSHMLAQKLYMVGFDNVLVYKDGFPDWQKRGLPVHQGTAP